MIISMKFHSLTIIIFSAFKSSSSSTSTIRYCNRGYCFTRKEHEYHHGLNQLAHPDAKNRDPSINYVGGSRKVHNKRIGLDFCTDGHGQVMDCELFEILGMDPDDVDIEYEALESLGGPPKNEEETWNESVDNIEEGFHPLSQDGDVIELDEYLPESKRFPWKERPKRGTCFDNDSGHTFDCNLIEIVDDGLLLIEDLRDGGVFAVQPQSVFTTRRRKIKNDLRVPEVLNGSGASDPSEDFRTNVFLNLEGI